MIIGYTSGVFDLFHVGHLNLLRNAKNLCDKLIVGVSTDELILKHKKHKPFIPFEERLDIVRNCRFTDVTIQQDTMDKLSTWKKLKFDIVLVGDDWFDTTKWKNYEKRFKKLGVRIIYFPYTKRISSSKLLNEILEKKGG